jgi:hypothetical protein
MVDAQLHIMNHAEKPGQGACSRTHKIQDLITPEGCGNHGRIAASRTDMEGLPGWFSAGSSIIRLASFQQYRHRSSSQLHKPRSYHHSEGICLADKTQTSPKHEQGRPSSPAAMTDMSKLTCRELKQLLAWRKASTACRVSLGKVDNTDNRNAHVLPLLPLPSQNSMNGELTMNDSPSPSRPVFSVNNDNRETDQHPNIIPSHVSRPNPIGVRSFE